MDPNTEQSPEEIRRDTMVKGTKLVVEGAYQAVKITEANLERTKQQLDNAIRDAESNGITREELMAYLLSKR